MKYLLYLVLLLLNGCFVSQAIYPPDASEMLPASLVPNNFVLYKDSTLQVDMVAPHFEKRQNCIAYGIDVTYYGKPQMYVENIEVEVFTAAEAEMAIASAMTIFTPKGKFNNLNFGDLPDSCRYSAIAESKLPAVIYKNDLTLDKRRSFKSARVPYSDAEASSKIVQKENRSFRVIKYHPKTSFDSRKNYVLHCYADLFADDRRVILDRKIHIKGYNN